MTRKVLFYIVLMLFSVAPLKGADRASIIHDITQVKSETFGSNYTYDNYDSIVVGRGIILSGRKFVIELLEGENSRAFAYTSNETNVIQHVNIPNPLIDIPTADDSRYDDILVDEGASSDETQLGRAPVFLLGEISVEERRFLEILVLPVTISETDDINFHSSLSFSIGNREITPENIKPSTDFYNKTRILFPEQSASATTRGKLVIITHSSFTYACERMKNYKVATGYDVRIKQIEEIDSEFLGRDNAEKLREYLKDFHATEGKYVLLVGDETLIPVRYASHINRNSQPELMKLLICDLYFADLTGEWDIDNDNIWGEPHHDKPDQNPELMVGRLPFRSIEQMNQYVDKLILYQTNPGNEDRSYLGRTLFFSSDQMRDYSEGGQHARIARAFPQTVDVDTVNGIEASRGDDLTPTNAVGDELGSLFSKGYGIVNVIAHGRSDGFVVRSAGVNQWPKSFLLTRDQANANLLFDSLSPSNKPAFYYSLACDNGGFDLDAAPFTKTSPTMVEALLAQQDGAVGFVAYSRWGWVNSSHLLHKAFFDSLFAHPGEPAAHAMYRSQSAYAYYRDLVYGQNYFGDPTVRIYTEIPAKIHLTIEAEESVTRVQLVSAAGIPIEGMVYLSENGALLNSYQIDSRGIVILEYPLDPSIEYTISAVSDRATIALVRYREQIVTSVNTDDESGLPTSFALHQNYPNPFNPSTQISFDLPTSSHVRLAIYNIAGQNVAVPIDKSLGAGTYTVEWDGSDNHGLSLASGVYFYRLESESAASTKKMILMK
ncbi:MAG: C25 family cysteine peptidase [candidate division Zixibacteria bacterium]|nr:C25 family cysteine peptidase [candidate division Zixibacteria bacterium]